MTEQRRERGQESAQENAGVVAEYADEYMPLAGYAGLMGAYIAIFGGLLVAGSGRRLPERISTPDLILRTSRGRGLRRAVGDLLTCPWCIGPWIASSLAAGLVVAPRTTRLIAGTFVIVTISDFLHHAYGAVRKLGG